MRRALRPDGDLPHLRVEGPPAQLAAEQLKSLRDPWIEAARHIKPEQLRGYAPSSIQKLKGASKRWRDILTVNRFDGARAVCLQDIDVWESAFEVPTEAVLAGYNFAQGVKLPSKDRFSPAGLELGSIFEAPIFNRDWTVRRRVEVAQVPNVQLPQLEWQEQQRQGPPRPAAQSPKFPEGHVAPLQEAPSSQLLRQPGRRR